MPSFFRPVAHSCAYFLTLALFIGFSLAGGNQANAFGFGDGTLPNCDTPGVLNKVEAQLSRAENFYRGTATLMGLEMPYELRLDDTSASVLTRRYCSARIVTDYDRRRTVYYMVEENAGFLGVSWGVEACLPPLDDFKVYGRHCQTVRPN